MMPEDDRWGNWPNSGEIDIMEHVGYAPEQSHFTAHCNKYHSSTARSAAYDTPRVYDDFHVFAIEWDTEGIYWYFDGNMIPAHEFYNESAGTQDDWKVWPFQRNFYLMLGLAYGGGWGGRNGIDWQLPMEFLVDYVRVYKLPGECNAIPEINAEKIEIYPNPVVNTLNFKGVCCLSEVLITNISGQTVAQFVDVENSIDLSNLNKGYYILQMKDKDGTPYAKKILKK
jgi:beta-glucanase (GH16 family)